MLCLPGAFRAGAPPLLVLDAKAEKQKEPFAFRTMKDAFKETTAPPSRQGLETLNASGSACPSAETLKKIKDKIGARKIVVVDLRQESHGLVNGLSVMWWGERNQANKGKTIDQVLKDEADRLDSLKRSAQTSINRLDIDDQKKTFEKKAPLMLKVQSIQSEPELCKANGLEYVRIPVTDRERPADGEVDRFVRFVRTLPEGTWLHFHCKAGYGRTTAFLAMYDMMRNAGKVRLEDILKRQHLLGGIDLATDPPRDNWRYVGAVDRRKFLERFFRYCQANRDGFKTSWSEWSAANPK